jgi:hypothetical protein
MMDNYCFYTNKNLFMMTNSKIIWIFNNLPLDEFKLRLSFEIWEKVFNVGNNNIDNMFNTFTNIYLQIFYAYKSHMVKHPRRWHSSQSPP